MVCLAPSNRVPTISDRRTHCITASHSSGGRAAVTTDPSVAPSARAVPHPARSPPAPSTPRRPSWNTAGSRRACACPSRCPTSSTASTQLRRSGDSLKWAPKRTQQSRTCANQHGSSGSMVDPAIQRGSTAFAEASEEKRVKKEGQHDVEVTAPAVGRQAPEKAVLAAKLRAPPEPVPGPDRQQLLNAGRAPWARCHPIITQHRVPQARRGRDVRERRGGGRGRGG